MLAGFEPSIQRVVVARRVVLRLVGILLRSLVIVLRGRLMGRRFGLLGRITMQGVHRRRLVLRLVIVVLRQRRRRQRGFVARALHPCRRARRSIEFVFRRVILLWAHVGPRLQRARRGLGRGPERVILPDQPCEFGKRITLAASLVGGRKMSVLISISHRDDASPTGQRQPAMSNKP